MGFGKLLNFVFDVAEAWDKCNKNQEFRDKIDGAKGFYNKARSTFGNSKSSTSHCSKENIAKYASLETKELRHIYYNLPSSPEKDMLAKLLDERGEPY